MKPGIRVHAGDVSRRCPSFTLLVWLGFACVGLAQNQSARAAGLLPVVAWTENKVEVLRNGATSWDPASTNADYRQLNRGDQLRTMENSRAGLLMADYRGVFIVGERSLFLVRSESPASSPFEFIKGRLFHFHRGPAGEQRIRTPSVAAVIRGTEYLLEVADDGATTLSLFNGEVELQNDAGRLLLSSGEQSVTEPGSAPRRTAAILSRQIVQWCLYYPGVLNLNDLPAALQRVDELTASIDAYRSGDLSRALSAYPSQRTPASAEEQVYRAALLLSAGGVESASALLESLPPTTAGSTADGVSGALSRMIRAVRGSEIQGPSSEGGTATEALVASYEWQAVRNLERALVAANRSVALQPDFAFAWVRVGELEFGFGRLQQARAALERGHRLAPRNAQAVALDGFLHAAQNRIGEAIRRFEQAIAVDGALGNAWLGRGLCRFRQGDRSGALEDLQMAAALEPERALPRSYLAKLWSESGQDDLALQDITLAQALDPADPTAWLYSGLIHQRLNHINEAVADVERSRLLNDNRAVFRSRQFLDQDIAVRGANLASVYRDAGLDNHGRAAAAGAVTADYANYSGHLFLADGFNALRDPRQINQRYETPWLSELLLANLLSPAAAGTLARSVSPLEYSSLLSRDEWQLRSTAQYSSHGDWWANGFAGAQYGNSSAALSVSRMELGGYAPNTESKQWSYDAKVKVDLTASDSFLVNVMGLDNESGDVRDYVHPRMASATLRFEESQEPNVYLGWHHAWAPGSHTLVLGARLSDSVTLNDPEAVLPVVSRTGTGTPTFAGVLSPFDLAYSSRLEGYSMEAQHIFQSTRSALIFGARYQEAAVRSASRQYFDPLDFPPDFLGTNAALSFVRQRDTESLRRLNGYVYEHLELTTGFRLLAGVAYEEVESPANADLPPLSQGDRRVSQWSPKAGFSWELPDTSELRAMYTRSLGGTYYDGSIRLEPAQLLGFPQAYRSAIPESVVGAVPGTRMDVASGEWIRRYPSRTYLSARIDGLWSSAHRQVGSFSYVSSPATADQLRQDLDYQELGFEIAVSQLVGSGGTIGIRYRASEAQLDLAYPELPAALPNDGVVRPRQHAVAFLQTIQPHAAYTHSRGWYVGTEFAFYVQDNDGHPPGLKDDGFVHWNLRAGWWLFHRKARGQIDLLNLTDQDYRLNPLNLHANLPRERTVLLSFQFSL